MSSFFKYVLIASITVICFAGALYAAYQYGYNRAWSKIITGEIFFSPSPEYLELLNIRRQATRQTDREIEAALDTPDQTALPKPDPEMEAALRTPGENSSTEEISAHFRLVHSLSVQTSTITMNPGCQISPRIIMVKPRTPLTFKNMTNEPIAVWINQASSSVAKDKTIVVRAPSSTRGGIYGFSCISLVTSTRGLIILDIANN